MTEYDITRDLFTTGDEFRNDWEFAQRSVERAERQVTYDLVMQSHEGAQTLLAKLQLQASLDIVTLLKELTKTLAGTLAVPPHIFGPTEIAVDGAALEALLAKYRIREQAQPVQVVPPATEIHVGEMIWDVDGLTRGYCGLSQIHSPHQVKTSSLGPYVCTGDPDHREPGRSERRRDPRKLSRQEAEEQAANINPQTGEA